MALFRQFGTVQAPFDKRCPRTATKGDGTGHRGARAVGDRGETSRLLGSPLSVGPTRRRERADATRRRVSAFIVFLSASIASRADAVVGDASRQPQRSDAWRRYVYEGSLEADDGLAPRARRPRQDEAGATRRWPSSPRRGARGGARRDLDRAAARSGGSFPGEWC